VDNQESMFMVSYGETGLNRWKYGWTADVCAGTFCPEVRKSVEIMIDGRIKAGKEHRMHI
jgi:hypothetical protein